MGINTLIHKGLQNGGGNFGVIRRAHRLGWSYPDYKILNIASRKGKFLTTRDYYSLHPLNGSESAWIDDKLTLKYILNGTDLSHLMPEYYFHINPSGRVLALADCKEVKSSYAVSDIVAVLEAKGILALKKCSASLGEGFIRAEYNRDKAEFTLNGRAYDKDAVTLALGQLRDYLVTEFLKPHPYFAKFNSRSGGCLRYVLGRRLNGELLEIYSFMRIGTKQSGQVENYNSGGVLTYIHDGKFDGGHILDPDKKKDVCIAHHPDNNLPIKGEIPLWKELKKAAFDFAALLPQLNYMGFDFCITDKNQVKLIEVNSLSSLDAMQLEKSIYDTPGGAFFSERLGMK